MSNATHSTEPPSNTCTARTEPPTTVGPKPLWVREHSCPACGVEADRDANTVVRLRLTGSKIATRFCDGVEHSFSRSTRCRSGILRRNACGDCAPYGHHLGVYKARRGNRKPHPQGANRVSGERVGRGSSQVAPRADEPLDCGEVPGDSEHYECPPEKAERPDGTGVERRCRAHRANEGESVRAPEEATILPA